MLTRDAMARSGDRLFRWRGQALLIFLPWMMAAAYSGEALEHMLGEGAGASIEGLSVLMIVGGLLVRIFAVGHAPAGTSGRNTTGQIAHELNTTGLYSLSRNPLYLGNSLTYLGLALMTQSAALTLAMALFLVIYYERIVLAEEAFLESRFGEVYLAWAQRVPAFWPRLSGWTPPALGFSLRATLRREYPSWLAAAVTVSAIVFLQENAEGEGVADEPLMLVLVGAVVTVSLVVRFLKRKTRLLDVRGR